jgi:hypothetical protein
MPGTPALWRILITFWRDRSLTLPPERSPIAFLHGARFGADRAPGDALYFL